MEDETRSAVGLSLIKQLALSEKTSRDKALYLLLDSWLPNQPNVSEDLMKKLWKGLFYCFWHSDKFPAQSQLADKLSSALPSLDLAVSIPYLSVFFLTMRREWSGIDVLRLDKFYLLIRRFVNNMFVLLKNNSWDLELSKRLVRVLEERVFFADDKFQGNGVNYHIASVFVEEITGFLPIRFEVVEVVFGPFVSIMGKLGDKVLLGKVKSNVFDVLVGKARNLLEVKKSGEELEPGSDVALLGSIAMSMGFSSKFYELGSSSECCQGNRKVIFGLHEEFLKLEKDFESSGIDVSVPDAVEHVEEEVPELIPIPSDQMGVDVSEPAERAEEAVPLKKCRGKGKASGGNDEATKAEKQKKKKKKKQKTNTVESDLGKSSMNEGNENEVNGGVEEFANIGIVDGDLIPLDESAISNLQMQFEKIAAEAGMNDNGVPSSCDSPTSTAKPTDRKKRKRSKAMNGKQSQTSDQFGAEGSNGTMAANCVEKNAKKVKFSMKNNLIWKPQNPLPPHCLRLPPSATPRGSALKKGVPPGPIREMPMQPKRAKLRVVSVKKARKAVKRLKKKSVSP